MEGNQECLSCKVEVDRCRRSAAHRPARPADQYTVNTSGVMCLQGQRMHPALQLVTHWWQVMGGPALPSA